MFLPVHGFFFVRAFVCEPVNGGCIWARVSEVVLQGEVQEKKNAVYVHSFVPLKGATLSGVESSVHPDEEWSRLRCQ